MSSDAARFIDRTHSPLGQRLLQVGMFTGLAGLAMELALIAAEPATGLRLLWFATIPLAPMILLVAPNVWVSVCPLSTVQTLSQRVLGMPKRRLPAVATERLQALGWILMLGGIPTRHLVFNVVGLATFGAALATCGVALVVGIAFSSLSGWCVGACPIRPIEVLYGQFAVERNRPEKCTTCSGCIASCQRVVPERSHGELHRSPLTANLAMGFPGFIAGYFLLDLLHLCNTEHQFLAGAAPAVSNWYAQAALVYGVMAGGFAVSWIVFRLLRARLRDDAAVYRAVALTAFCAYYLGVAPEISEAWNWPAWSVPLLLMLPAGALVIAVRPHGPKTATPT
jgi:ferredoxin